MLITTIIICTFGIIAITDAIFIHVDPGQSSFIFIFVPIGQIVVSLLGIGVATILYNLTKKSNTLYT